MGQDLVDFRHELRAAMAEADMTLDQLTEAVRLAGLRVGRTTLGNALVVTKPPPQHATIEAFIHVFDEDDRRGWRARWDELCRTDAQLRDRKPPMGNAAGGAATRTMAPKRVTTQITAQRGCAGAGVTGTERCVTSRSPARQGTINTAPSVTPMRRHARSTSSPPETPTMPSAPTASSSPVSAPRAPARIADRYTAGALTLGILIGSTAVWGVQHLGRDPEPALATNPDAPLPRPIISRTVNPADILDKDPMGRCDSDATSLARRDISDKGRVILMWSESCMAYWVRFQRLDGRTSGTVTELTVYEHNNTAKRVSATDREVSSSYSFMLPRPADGSGVCGTATIRTDNVSETLAEPVC